MQKHSTVTDGSPSPDTLSDRTFWDDVSAQRLHNDALRLSAKPGIRSKFRSLFSEHYWGMLEHVCASYIPYNPSLKLLEVGCAPGYKLLRLHSVLGYEPYGLEYVPSGVADTQRLFVQNGFDPAHVFHCDLFARETMLEHRERYDLVTSFGFVEHFRDPVHAIRLHAEMARPGGYLLVHIPKLVGVNWLTMWLFRREFIETHNLDIMRARRFKSLFQDIGLEEVFCGEVGFFKIYGLFTKRERSFRGLMARGASKLQVLLNAGMRIAFIRRNVTWVWSPCLVYIGRKPCVGDPRQPSGCDNPQTGQSKERVS